MPVKKPNTTEGYCYFTPDDGKFYIDIDTKTNDTSGRIALNADKADRLNISGPIGHAGNPIYLDADGKPVDCGYQRRIGVEGDGAYAEIFNYNGDDPDFINNIADGDYSHAEGHATAATGKAAHAEGGNIDDDGQENLYTIYHNLTDGTAISVYGSTASGDVSHAEGYRTLAYGHASHAEGRGTLAEGTGSHAEGYWTVARKWGAHAEGGYSRALEDSSHAEGYGAYASGFASHAEGLYSSAIGECSHAEGNSKVVSSHGHSEGYGVQVGGKYSHAEGKSNNTEIKLICTHDSENKILTLNDDTARVTNNDDVRNMYNYFSYNDGFG